MLKKTLKQLIKTMDFFSQPITFRYSQQPSYQSLTGGFCSIILLILFVTIFTNTVLDTLNRVNIDARITSIQEDNPSYYRVGTDSFMFGIGITGLDLNTGDKWFQIYFEKSQYYRTGKNKSRMKLVKCEREQWMRVKKQIGELYDTLGLDKWLCPADGTQLELQGKFSSEIFKFYKIGVRMCTSAVATPDRPCADNATITKFIETNQNFNLNFYFINTILNPNNEKFLDYYLDGTNYFPFTLTEGVAANLFLSTFSIETDQSILPYQYLNKTSGGVCQSQTQMINYKVQRLDYLKVYIRKSSLTLDIERSFRKIDDTISYIGGLFSAILIGLALVGKYNQACYQLEVAKNLFHYDRNRPLKGDQFNFLIFLGCLVYSLFDKIGVNLPWKRMQRYFQSLEEVRKQMDIRLVIKKILYSERMAIAVFDQPKAKILHLQEPLTLSQAQQIRKDHRLYQKLQKKFFDYKKIRQEETGRKTFADEKKSLQIQPNQISHTCLVPANQRSYKQQTLENVQQLKKVEKMRPLEQFNKNNLPLSNNYNQNYYSYDNNNKSNEDNYKNYVRKKYHNKSTNQQNLKKLSQKQRKEKQLLGSIQEMKNCLHILELQSQAGDTVSKKILNRFDKKLIKYCVEESNTENSKSREKDKERGMDAHAVKQGQAVEQKQQNRLQNGQIFDLNRLINEAEIIVLNSNNQIMGQQQNDLPKNKIPIKR